MSEIETASERDKHGRFKADTVHLNLDNLRGLPVESLVEWEESFSRRKEELEIELNSVAKALEMIKEVILEKEV